MSVSRNEGAGSGNIRGIIYSERKKGGSVKGDSAIRGGRSGRRGRPERVIHSDHGGGYEENLERWEEYSGPVKACEECGEVCTEKMVDWSILDTYRCKNDHRRIELKP